MMRLDEGVVCLFIKTHSLLMFFEGDNAGGLSLFFLFFFS